MAKSTRANGPSFTEEELNDPAPPVVVRRAMLGGEPKSVGTHSSGRSLNEQSSSEQETRNRQGRVQTMGNLFDQTEEEDSTVNLTDGNGQTETTKLYDEMTAEELRSVCREYGIPSSGNRNVLMSRIRDHEEQFVQDSADDEFN